MGKVTEFCEEAGLLVAAIFRNARDLVDGCLRDEKVRGSAGGEPASVIRGRGVALALLIPINPSSRVAEAHRQQLRVSGERVPHNI